MKAWAHDELLTLDLGDTRLNQRCLSLLDALADLPEASFSSALASPAATKATYRFLKNPHFQTDAILAAHRDRTVQRGLEHPHLLALHDTTSLTYSAHPHTKGLGYLGNLKCQGFFVHSVLLCSAPGIPLGLCHQQVWARDNAQVGKKKLRRKAPIEQKESFKWLTALQSVLASFPTGPDVTVISDQESDLFEYFVVPRPAHIHLLLRARTDRLLPEGTILTHLQRQPCAGEFDVSIPRTDSQKARTARLAVRFATVEFLPPQQHARRKELQPVVLSAVLAEEVSAAPAGSAQIRWLLLTTRPVTSFAEARACVEQYSCRWLIERYHYVLKSGCQLEALQLSTRERLERALALYSVVGWRLLWMTYLARKEPETSCEAVFERHEWEALHGYLKPREPLPAAPPTIRVVVRWLAQMGGFQGRKGDGEPGVKVLWKGLAKLELIVQTWQILQQNPHLLKVSKDVGNA